jgi:hypothetical protein
MLSIPPKKYSTTEKYIFGSHHTLIKYSLHCLIDGSRLSYSTLKSSTGYYKFQAPA